MRLYITIISILLFSSCSQIRQGKIRYEYTEDSPQVEFSVEEIKAAINEIESTKAATMELKLDPELGEQSFTLNREGGKIVISGGDETGLMYGGLELAEWIRIQKGIPELKQEVHSKPYILQRGLKFNVPLDIRTPSYQDAGDAAQNNILEMWNFDFWKAYLDMMARNRYNVLTLWNPHPFPSMLQLDNYPEVALQDVCGTTFPLDTDRPSEAEAKFIAGCGVSKQVMDNLVVLKEMTMDEKIEYWRKVMKYAKDRGVETYFITWNIMMNSLAPPGWYRHQDVKMGEKGKLGINNDQENPRTIAYLRESVKEFILTYPDVAGIGITAGENMENRDDEYDREKWIWSTYGEGVLDAKKIQPDREVKFVHRFWSSGVETIVDDFTSKYPDPIDLSFKYARARMYATPAPRWADNYIEKVRANGLKSWWNIRNDDIFNFRWGDPEYASEFIKNIPPQDITAGYFMGSDGYVWGREFTSKHPQEPRELEIDKHWYNFMLWGRMGYNPGMEEEKIKGLLELHYPGADIGGLHSAWATASRIPSMVTRFHWNDWDWLWAVEGCLDLDSGFHTVNRFINNPTFDEMGIQSIPNHVEDLKTGTSSEGLTPQQVADKLETLADEVLLFLDSEKKLEGKISTSYDELLYDLQAWAWMGKYYAEKIRGAAALHAFREGLGGDYQDISVKHLQQALKMWEKYTAAATRNYKPQFMAKTRTIDWEALKSDVEKDIRIARGSQ